MVAVVLLGYWLGKILRLQKLSNRIGHHAASLLSAAQKDIRPAMARMGCGLQPSCFAPRRWASLGRGGGWPYRFFICCSSRP